MTHSRILMIALGVLTLLRFVLLGSHELQEDEAYYFQWAQRMDWSYYSKGPGVATAIKIGTFLFGDNEFGVRFWVPLLGLGTSLLLFSLIKDWFEEVTASWTVLLLNVTPIFTAGGMMMTIDPLSVFFWVLAMWLLWRAVHWSSTKLETASHWKNFWWPLVGLAIGLGFLCKYTNAMQFISIVFLLLVITPWRVEWRRPGVYLMFVVFFLCITPVLIWNHQNHWITFTHVVERGSLTESRGIDAGEFLSYLGLHLAVYSPIVLVGLLWGVSWGVKECWTGFRNSRDAMGGVLLGVPYALAFSLPVILMYFILSFREAGEPNWTVPGFVSGAALLPLAWKKHVAVSGWFYWLRSVALLIAGVMSLVLVQTDVARAFGLPWGYVKNSGIDDRSNPKETMRQWVSKPAEFFENAGDPSQRMRGWIESAEVVAETVTKWKEAKGEELFVIAARWQSASALNFYLPKDLPVIRPNEDFPLVHVPQGPLIQNQYSFWPRYDALDAQGKSAFEGKNALFIEDRPRTKKGNSQKYQGPPSLVDDMFDRVELLRVVDVVRQGRVVRRLAIFLCENYRSKLN